MELPAAGCKLLHLSSLIPQLNYPSVYLGLCQQACNAATPDLLSDIIHLPQVVICQQTFDATRKNMQRRSGFCSCLSPYGWFPRTALPVSLRARRTEAEICASLLPLHCVLTANEEMWSKFLVFGANFYTRYDSHYGQILWIGYLFPGIIQIYYNVCKKKCEIIK